MAKVAVFDSGLGSLSIVSALKRQGKKSKRNLEIIYLADQLSFPYGKKTKPQLRKIINSTIKTVRKNFEPDIIVVGSNTPTIMFPKLTDSPDIAGVLPPLKEAAQKSKTNNVAILATKASLKFGLDRHIKNYNNKTKFHKIDASRLVELVEKTYFATDRTYCSRVIKAVLSSNFKRHNIDVATLSSTHLPFLSELLQKEFPQVNFLDPAENVAKEIFKKLPRNKTKNKLQIYTTGNTQALQKKLQLLGVRNKKITKIDIS